MVDMDTFLTILYVMADDFCQSQQPLGRHHPGPQAALSCSEVVTLALFGQWVQFPSERAFYRYAEHHAASCVSCFAASQSVQPPATPVQ